MSIVEFKSLDEFLLELREEATNIANKIVRWEVVRAAEQAEGVTYQLGMWVTAIAKGNTSNDDFLIELWLLAGRDGPEADDLDGTKAIEVFRQQLVECCDDLGLKLRTGKIEVC